MITIHYDCPGCGLKRKVLQVPARPTLDVDDLLPWMEDVKNWIREDHKAASPNCKHKYFNMYIPYPKGSEGIGQQIE